MTGGSAAAQASDRAKIHDVGDNIRLCKFTPDGALRWGKDIDGGDDDLGYTVAVDASDRIIASGTMISEQTDQDAWLAIFSP